MHEGSGGGGQAIVKDIMETLGNVRLELAFKTATTLQVIAPPPIPRTRTDNLPKLHKYDMGEGEESAVYAETCH